jgi:hypothetical protein
MSRRFVILRTRKAALAGCAALLVLLVALSGAALAASSMSKANPGTITLKASFKRFGSGELLGYANRVLVFDHGSGTGMLINGTTTHRRSVTSTNCPSPVAIGGSSIVFFCSNFAGAASPSYEIYKMDTAQFQVLAIAAFESVSAVGGDWVSLAGVCEDTQHCAQRYSLQNLGTGAMVGDPTTATATIDLDAANPARLVCAPVTVPVNGQDNPESPATVYGSVVSDGRFQIATSNGGSYLEKCGSHLHQLLTFTSYPGCAHQACSPPFNAHAILWQSKPGRLTGVFLPSVKRFTIAVPATVDRQAESEQFVNGNQYELALTTHTLYLGVRNTVWTMQIPSSPPRPKPRPTKH